MHDEIRDKALFRLTERLCNCLQVSHLSWGQAEGHLAAFVGHARTVVEKSK
jgi:hypothetical protein